MTGDVVLEAPGELIHRDHEHKVEDELEPRGRALPFVRASEPWRLVQRPLDWAMCAGRILGGWLVRDAHRSLPSRKKSRLVRRR
jgi:hypothetical protein